MMDIIVCEHRDDVVLPASIGEFVKVRAENYGIIAISIYKYEGEGTEWQVLPFVQGVLIQLHMDI